MRNRLNICLLFALLGLVLSYNLDLECLLATQDNACEVACQESIEDTCADPSLGSAPPAVLPSRPFSLPAFLAEQMELQPVDSGWDSPRDPAAFLPLGLRAPPSA